MSAAMGDNSSNIASLMYRIEQLEHEREELRRDIEQLCMQQSGTGYLGIITRIQSQRAAGLEQEVELLKQKLVTCMRENQNLQEELSEVYHIKSQLADLHKSEVEKNNEAEQQIKFFQNRVAAAFAERDRALMEVEKTYQKEAAMADKLNQLHNRIEEITADCLEEKRLCSELQSNLGESKAEISKLKQVIKKFFQIRQEALGIVEEGDDEGDDEDMAALLLQDPADLWSFGEADCISEAKGLQMASLEDQLVTSSNMIENLHKQLEEACTSEDLLVKRVNTLEEELKHLGDTIKNELSLFHIFQVQNRNDVLNLLEDEQRWLITMAEVLQNEIKQRFPSSVVHSDSLHLGEESQSTGLKQNENIELNENGESFFRRNTAREDTDSPDISSKGVMDTDDSRKALAQALQEKVSALLLLSQQEERHLLEKNTNSALEEKLKELQHKMLQVTNEKVAALMEVARLRQECQNLQEHGRGPIQEVKQSHISNTRSVVLRNEKESSVKQLLKRAYLKHWMRGLDFPGIKASPHIHGEDDCSTPSKPNDAMEFARLKVENASLHESLANMEHLTSSIHHLRLALLKAKDEANISAPAEAALEAIDSIMNEAQHIKTALGSSLPVSWSGVGSLDLPNSSESEIGLDNTKDQTIIGPDSVSSAGFELVELLILSAELLKAELVPKFQISSSS